MTTAELSKKIDADIVKAKIDVLTELREWILRNEITYPMSMKNKTTPAEKANQMIKELKAKLALKTSMHLYSVGDQVNTLYGKGTITDYQTSHVDGKSIPSYWIRLEIHKDGHPRNVWQTSITGKI